MRFVRDTLRNDSNGATAEIYLPTSEMTSDDASDFTLCDVDGDVRSINTNVLNMMRTFRNERLSRQELLHDCVVFALACTTGNPYTDHEFEPGVKPIRVGKYNFSAPYEGASFLQEPDIEAAQVAFTVDASPIDSDFRDRTHEFHFMVRATERYDPGGILYISKFGVAGPIALHTFTATHDYYPAVAAGHAEGMIALGIDG